MTAIMPFEFESNAVRVVDLDGQCWFVLADVCKVLEHSNASMAADLLDDDEKNTLNITEGIPQTGPGNPNVNVINESGLYALILKSRKAAAKRFRKWVTAEVLPTIRATGRYEANPSPAGEAGRVRDLEAEIAAFREKTIALLEENRALLKRDASQKAADRHVAVALKLIEKTALSDAEIADILAPSLGRHMPEWVAYERRLHRERATRH